MCKVNKSQKKVLPGLLVRLLFVTDPITACGTESERKRKRRGRRQRERRGEERDHERG